MMLILHCMICHETRTFCYPHGESVVNDEVCPSCIDSGALERELKGERSKES